jgi:hypothetical protein
LKGDKIMKYIIIVLCLVAIMATCGGCKGDGGSVNLKANGNGDSVSEVE